MHLPNSLCGQVESILIYISLMNIFPSMPTIISCIVRQLWLLQSGLTHSFPKIPIEIDVWIHHTFDNNLGIIGGLKNIWRIDIDGVLFNISPSNIFPTMLSPARFHQRYQATFCHCRYEGVSRSPSRKQHTKNSLTSLGRGWQLEWQIGHPINSDRQCGSSWKLEFCFSSHFFKVLWLNCEVPVVNDEGNLFNIQKGFDDPPFTIWNIVAFL